MARFVSVVTGSADVAAELQRDERTEADGDANPRGAPRDRTFPRIDVIAAMRDQIDRETEE